MRKCFKSNRSFQSKTLKKLDMSKQTGKEKDESKMDSTDAKQSTSKRIGDVVYLDSDESSGIETEYETLVYKVNGMPHFKRQRLYKVRQKHSLPYWMIKLEKEEHSQKSKRSKNICPSFSWP